MREKMKSIILIISMLSCIHCLPFLDRTIHTPKGKIRGTTFYYGTQPVQTFLGIPYVKPPVGNLRFRKPEEVQSWPGTLMANHLPPACVQFTIFPFPWYDSMPGKSEDCLYLNIWVPGTTQKADKKAVFFWIHGGGFTFGSNRMDLYDGRALAAAGDVIVVTINYRLGLFGFLTSGTDEAPGNYGLYDMLEALKWVRENIESFGGDPERITIDGESVGASAVSAFCVSPLTKGLFSRAILQSGSVLPFTRGLMGNNIQLGWKLAETVGCASQDNTLSEFPKNVIDCLRGKSAAHLAYALLAMQPSATVSFFPISGDEFLPEDPGQELRDGNFYDIPLLIGNTGDEGAFLVTTPNSDIFGFFGEKDPAINKTQGEAIIRRFLSRFTDPDALVEHYLGHLEENDHNTIRRQVYTAYGDIILLCATVYVAESYATKNNSVYYYLFDHRASVSPWASWMGMGHFEDVQFVFGVPLLYPERYQPDEVELSAKMVKIFSHFATHGYPTDDFEWPKYSIENPVYVTLNTDFNGNYFGRGLNEENCNFFREFYGF